MKETVPWQGFQGKMDNVPNILSEEKLLFSEIKRKLPNLAEVNLTIDLRLLESYGLIHREVYQGVPPKVESSLTDIGNNRLPILDSISRWTTDKYTSN